MTKRQLHAVLKHLYAVADPTGPGRDPFEDMWWRYKGGPCPAWLRSTFDDWLAAWHDKDYAELARWIPAPRLGQFAKVSARNRHLSSLIGVRYVHRSLNGDLEATAARLRKDPSTIARALRKLKRYERESKRFWNAFFESHPS